VVPAAPESNQIQTILQLLEHLYATSGANPESWGNSKEEEEHEMLKRFGIAVLVITVLSPAMAGVVLGPGWHAPPANTWPERRACGGNGSGVRV